MRRVMLAWMVMGVVGLIAVVGVASEEAVQRIQQAEALHSTRYTQEVMMQIIDLYQAVLPDLDTLAVQSQSFVLNRLAQLCYEATTLTEDPNDEDEGWFDLGKAYGLQSLRLNSAFAAAEQEDFAQAVSHAIDPAALHWTASNWGKLLGLHPIEGIFQQDKVLALFGRSVEIDPGYWGGSSMSSLGSLLIMSPEAMGGDDEAGLQLLHDAIAFDPAYLPNRVILAEYWGFTYNYFGALVGVRDADLITQELTTVLESEALERWPFWNRNAQRNAAKLLDQLEEMAE